MRDVDYPVADGLALTCICVALEAKVGGVNDLLVGCLVRQYQTEIIRGKKKALNLAVRAPEEVIGFLKPNRGPALWTLLFYCKAHFILTFLRSDCRKQSQADSRSCIGSRP